MKKMSKYTIRTKEMIIEPSDENNIWEDDWNVWLIGKKKNRLGLADNTEANMTQIGTASFAGYKEKGTIPVSVTLYDEYRNKKYGTEVFKLMVEFAFGFSNIYIVKAQTDRENYSCVYALEKAGFVYRTKEKNLQTYTVSKPKSTWLGLYMLIGLVAGLGLGIVLNSSWVGLIIGLVLGFMCGNIMDANAKKAREKVTGENE